MNRLALIGHSFKMKSFSVAFEIVLIFDISFFFFDKCLGFFNSNTMSMSIKYQHITKILGEILFGFDALFLSCKPKILNIC